ncbi:MULTISPECIES: preprotein translocase subunit SecY [Paenibacillus]|jgi:preprotein translocase subunit SecY|uniref:Protein translocase subunit SecY n=3 Tax=Paenibacillus TaxID=44249 RepID=A0A2V3RNR1_9BACL|nr:MULTISPECIES: preprotein translocase subunit SecY [Paenibacillus]MDR9749666.1 preprotein translocase subunit SecY [Paenibacillus taichungensis]MEC0110966.1 preprotein translocase subunit SecY [Paenibacillus taichungensis]MEC0126939.1 preprotein translocase subunit SecY [Paenibacillus pabuli]MEC0200284.1 preprotein translocase subunit SecY [Paenibacillus taichungensis]NUU52790.1 preprotein translocase subunit SecY [Paenibacillus taichungensis]
MFKTLKNIWRVEDLRKRVLFTLFVLIIYRIGSFVPVPGVNKDVFEATNSAGKEVFGLLNTFSGGALFQFSIFALGIVPYITASIIVQLLSMDVIPKLAEWAKQGEQGKKKSAQLTRYLTVGLALIQAFGTSIGFNRLYNTEMVPNATFADYILIAIVLTAGTSFLMWLGEQITEKGIGNGISILIFAGILSTVPNIIKQTIESDFIQADQLFMNILKGVIVAIVIVLIIIGVIYIQQAIRKIPVQYAKRVVGNKMYGGQNTHIPLKINAAGVIPVIFASSLLMFPSIIANFWADRAWAQWIGANLTTHKPLGMLLYVVMIFGFTFFYTFVQMNPQQMADNMKKNGGYIPGIRPGKATEKYLTRVMTRLTTAGAIFLAVISVLPVILGALSGLPQSAQIGGTSLLIVIGVALDTMKQIESQLIKRHYKGFINK